MIDEKFVRLRFAQKTLQRKGRECPTALEKVIRIASVEGAISHHILESVDGTISIEGRGRRDAAGRRLDQDGDACDVDPSITGWVAWRWMPWSITTRLGVQSCLPPIKIHACLHHLPLVIFPVCVYTFMWSVGQAYMYVRTAHVCTLIWSDGQAYYMYSYVKGSLPSSSSFALSTRGSVGRWFPGRGP